MTTTQRRERAQSLRRRIRRLEAEMRAGLAPSSFATDAEQKAAALSCLGAMRAQLDTLTP